MANNSAAAKPIPDGFTAVTEGQATALFRVGEVFYNKAQVQNRDLSIAVIRTFERIYKAELAEKEAKRKEKLAKSSFIQENGEDAGTKIRSYDGLTILEGLSASGLRACRYAKEIPELKKVIANDFDAKAVESIQRNIDFNDVGDKVVANHADAVMLMMQNRAVNDRFDVVDLDPYGSASIFLDSAMQSVAEGGLLCVTCTDLAVLAGAHPESCFTKYGSVALRGKHCHEQALRILLHTLEAAATRHKRHIKPLISIHMDFYVRVFVRVYTSPLACKSAFTRSSIVWQCTGCGSYATQNMGRAISRSEKSTRYIPSRGPPVGQRCGECGAAFNLGGPMWTEPMCDPKFVELLAKEMEDGQAGFKSFKRVHGLVKIIESEVAEVPLFMELGMMTHVMNCVVPPRPFVVDSLEAKGYKVSASHTSANAIKTDAPLSLLWDVMRCWVKHSEKPLKHRESHLPSHAILSKEPTELFDFSNVSSASSLRHKRRKGGQKFHAAPQDNWGPLARAGSKRAKTLNDPQDGAPKADETSE